jgi:hypothetical protein
MSRGEDKDSYDDSYHERRESTTAKDVRESAAKTPVIRRNNDVKRGVITYQGSPTGKGAVKNAVEVIRNRNKTIQDL